MTRKNKTRTLNFTRFNRQHIGSFCVCVCVSFAIANAYNFGMQITNDVAIFALTHTLPHYYHVNQSGTLLQIPTTICIRLVICMCVRTNTLRMHVYFIMQYDSIQIHPKKNTNKSKIIYSLYRLDNISNNIDTTTQFHMIINTEINIYECVGH